MQQAGPGRGSLVGVSDPETDPVLRHRAQVLHWTSIGQRIGYACFGAAMVLFFVGLVAQFPAWLVTTIVALMVAGSIVLLPSIILSYAAKAADKEDRGEPFGY